MGRTTSVLKWVGSKAASGIKYTGSAIGKKIDESLEEQKHKNTIYKEEYKKAEQEERIKLKLDRYDDLRRKAREDARRKVRGTKKEEKKKDG